MITVTIERERDDGRAGPPATVRREEPAIARRTLIEYDLRFGAAIVDGDPNCGILVLQSTIGCILETRTYRGKPDEIAALFMATEQFRDAIQRHGVEDLDLIADAAMCSDYREPCIISTIRDLAHCHVERPFHGRA